MSNIVIISGSPSVSSRLNGLINALREQLTGLGHSVETITVVDLPAEDLVHSRFGSEAIVKANGLVAQADGVVIASPVYKASFTGVLKSYLDLLPQRGLEGKVIAPLFVGGSLAHLLSIDFSLKPVLATMEARLFARSVYATDNQIKRTEEPQGSYSFELDNEVTERLQATATELHEELKRRS